jgi:hypothetical protein
MKFIKVELKGRGGRFQLTWQRIGKGGRPILLSQLPVENFPPAEAGPMRIEYHAGTGNCFEDVMKLAKIIDACERPSAETKQALAWALAMFGNDG